MDNFLEYIKLGIAALVIIGYAVLWGIHEHDKNTIAAKVQLLAQASEKQALDAATVAQLRADLAQSNTVVGGLAAQTVVAYKAAATAQASAAQASAPIVHEITALQKKASAPVAASLTCADAIREWRARQ